MKLIFTNDIGVNLDSANLMSFYFLKENYSCEVWDVSEIYDKKGTVKNIDEAISIDTLEEFELGLEKSVQEQKVIIITNMIEKAWKKLQGIAKKYGVPVISMQKNNFIDLLQAEMATDMYIKLPIKRRIGCLIKKYKLTRFLYSRIKNANVKFDYLISAYNSKPETVKKFVRGHNVKYDEYLAGMNSPNIIGEKYILFIDCALCYHPIDYNKPDCNFSSEHYLRQLNRYFNLIEDKYKMPVVISLHPVSCERLSSEMFGGRHVLYGKTALLIQHATFAISHFSTSLINVVLAKKPAIIVSSFEIEHSDRRYVQVYAEVFAKLCGFSKDSLDNPTLPEVGVDVIKYNSFIEKYLIDTSQMNNSNSEIILNLLKKIEREL